MILRGTVSDERAAGPMKEEAIAKACLHDAWAPAVIDCVGGTTAPRACLDQLDARQRAAYRTRLEQWADAFPDEELDDAELPEDEPVDFVDCAQALGDLARYEPALTIDPQHRELAVALRRHHVRALCEDWSTEVRRCFEMGHAPAQCRALLEPDQQQVLTDRLAEVDALMAKVVAVKPAASTCKQVVALHYADAKWSGRLDGYKPAERKQLIADARVRMAKACRDEHWSASLRGCIVARGGEPCFVAAGIGAFTWGYPPSAIVMKTGIPECDAYGDAVRALAACPKLPAATAQTLLESHRQLVQALANTGTAQRGAASTACKQADAAIRQAASSVGCTI